jgi:hypothetical protein
MSIAAARFRRWRARRPGERTSPPRCKPAHRADEPGRLLRRAERGRIHLARSHGGGAGVPERTVRRGRRAYVWVVLAASSVGLLAAALARLFGSAFFALGDTTTPFRCAATRMLVVPRRDSSRRGSPRVSSVWSPAGDSRDSPSLRERRAGWNSSFSAAPFAGASGSSSFPPADWFVSGSEQPRGRRLAGELSTSCARFQCRCRLSQASGHSGLVYLSICRKP